MRHLKSFEYARGILNTTLQQVNLNYAPSIALSRQVDYPVGMNMINCLNKKPTSTQTTMHCQLQLMTTILKHSVAIKKYLAKQCMYQNQVDTLLSISLHTHASICPIGSQVGIKTYNIQLSVLCSTTWK